MDISNRRDSLAMDQWHVVYIPRSRVFEASNRTFLGLLHAENSIDFDPTTEYPVYSAPAKDGDGMHYFFSPVIIKSIPGFSKVLECGFDGSATGYDTAAAHPLRPSALRSSGGDLDGGLLAIHRATARSMGLGAARAGRFCMQSRSICES